jgi:hypothetical protein
MKKSLRNLKPSITTDGEKFKAEMLRDLKNHTAVKEEQRSDPEAYQDRVKPFLMCQQLSTTSKRS